MESFWFVYRVGGDAPQFRHPEEKLAVEEAKRLAVRHANAEFFVLQATHRVKIGRVSVDRLLTIPF